MYEPSEKSLTKTRHYHVSVGPLEVNIYNIKGLDFVGPYTDIIYPDAESAVRAWAGLANEIGQIHLFEEVNIDDEDIEDLIEDITSSEWAFTYDDGLPNVGYEFGDGDQFITLTDCDGCLPKSNN